jgi:hypothetical protein
MRIVDLNETGDGVGHGRSGSGISRCIYLRKRQSYVLHPAGWRGSSGAALNDDGVIVAKGQNAMGSERLYVLRPKMDAEIR